MRILALLMLMCFAVSSCTPFEGAESRAKRYQPLHLRNGFYQFDLASWPWSLVEFEQRHAGSLRVVSFGPVYNADGKVVGMLVLTEVREISHGSR